MVTKAVAISNASNDAKDDIELQIPYSVEAELEGTAPLLFHRWSCEAVEEKANSKKGSTAKKTDNLESYLWRDKNGMIAIPGEYVRQSLIHAAKFKQDPRSPRKSAMDLYKAGVAAVSDVCTVISAVASKETKEADFLDRRRVVIMRSGITRVRPALLSGWKIKVEFMILLPEYIEAQKFHETLSYAGRIVGLADFRPSFGRFQVNSFRVIELTD